MPNLTRHYRKKLSNKRLWLRSIANKSVAIAEYRGVQRCNICKPIQLDKPDTYRELKAMKRTIDAFTERTKRTITAKLDRTDLQAIYVAEQLGIKIE